MVEETTIWGNMSNVAVHEQGPGLSWGCHGCPRIDKELRSDAEVAILHRRPSPNIWTIFSNLLLSAPVLRERFSDPESRPSFDTNCRLIPPPCFHSFLSEGAHQLNDPATRPSYATACSSMWHPKRVVHTGGRATPSSHCAFMRARALQ